MTRKFFSARVFTLSCGLGYAIAIYGDYPLFRYYPLVKRFSLEDLATRSLGPAISWYGWIATAAVAAVLVAAVVPKSLGNRIPVAAIWVVTVAMLIAAWYRERQWFL
jgi:hypothetical protein